MKNFLPVLLILFLSACSSATADAPALIQPSPAPPTESVNVEIPSPICIAPEPTQADVDRALSFTGKIFETDDWIRTYTVSADRVSVFWESPSLAGIVFLEAVIFPCSYEEPDLDNYFSLESWQIVFGGYQSYEYVTECSLDSGERLYQFMLADQSFEYDANYWSVNDTPTRVITIEIILPFESQALMEEYSYSLFPQIPSC